MGNRLLLRGGCVLTVDPELGDLPKGDVLIDGGSIAGVAPQIDADAEVVDVSGDIVIPGFVDTHRHTWEAAIRGCAPNATLDDYFVEVLDTFAPLYRPEDVYASNLAGALECVNAGITTLVDWSHINNTPEHPDAAISGLSEAGIRAQYAYGSANTSLSDYWYQSKIAIPRNDVRRVRDTYFSSDDGLLTMALATRGPGFCLDEVVRSEWETARELGIPITVHVAMGRVAGRFGMIKQLSDLGLLGPDTTYIHCCYFSDEEWRLVADSGGTISIAPQIEAQMGHGWPPVMKAREYGLRPSLSIDVVTTAPGDMFTQIRSAFGCERARVNAACWEADTGVPETMLTARDMLQMATIDGARVAGLENRTGSLTPGKKADIVVIDAHSLNVAPVIDPVAAVTLSADVSKRGHRDHRRKGPQAGRQAAGRRRQGAPAGPGVQGLPGPAGRAEEERVTSRHLVRRSSDAALAVPQGWKAHCQGFARWSVVDEAAGAVHTGFGSCALEPGGHVAAHVHSYEESFHVLEGEVVLETSERAFLLVAGDYGLLPVGVPHAWRSDGAAARWADMLAPQPRARFGGDTFFVSPLEGRPPLPVDVRDPRTRSLGHIEPASMDTARQTQELLAVSASMRTALLVYSGITVKMMVDTDLGAVLSTMFMVQYEPRGVAGTHDHPLEETYLILDGEVDASFDGERYRLGAGDVAWAGVGCVHGFANARDDIPVRWLETQAPQPPARHSYRFTRDWDHLGAALAQTR